MNSYLVALWAVIALLDGVEFRWQVRLGAADHLCVSFSVNVGVRRQLFDSTR